MTSKANGRVTVFLSADFWLPTVLSPGVSAVPMQVLAHLYRCCGHLFAQYSRNVRKCRAFVGGDGLSGVPEAPGNQFDGYKVAFYRLRNREFRNNPILQGQDAASPDNRASEPRQDDQFRR